MIKLLLLSIFFYVIVLPRPVYALTFGLIGPTEQLVRGQEVTFTITVDTKGESLSTARIGLQYETQYLEFLNAIPGDTFTSISVEEIEPGKLVLTGTSTTPFNGEGVFSYVKFKLIADSPGTSQLCSLFNPDSVETSPTPTTTPTPTTPPPQAQTTSIPTPTALLKSGSTSLQEKAFTIGVVLLTLPLAGLVLSRFKRIPF